MVSFGRLEGNDRPIFKKMKIMKKRLEIETIECAGFGAMLKTLKLPYGKECDSTVKDCIDEIFFKNEAIEIPVSYVYIEEKDIALLKKLILRGDEHAKAMRMPQVWANITAPRWFWHEMQTYEIGVTKGCSNSTMHQECKLFEGEDLQNVKDNIKEGTLQTRTYMFSYQALRRIYFQRKTHRLLVWREFCEWIKALPLSEELITFGYDCND